MPTWIATLALASLFPACSSDAAPLPLQPMPAVAQHYTYGAKFEPPDGRVLHGMGSWTTGNANYLAALDDPQLDPAMSQLYVHIGDWPRTWESRLATIKEQIASEVAQGRILHVGIAFRGMDPQTAGRHVEEMSIDREVAGSTRYDERLRDLARLIGASGAPAFVRIGFEFSGDWNGYSPYAYPLAFRHVVDVFRAEQVDNAAFVWCWEASCAPDFDEQGADGWRWYPGDDYVDWFAVDLFAQSAFSGTTGRGGRPTRLGNTLKFLAMAEAHGRPVMVAESGAVTVGITPDEQDGRQDWDAWFGPFFEFLAAHPGIKAFHYCNSDWKDYRGAEANGWQDGDISHNAWIARQYAQALRDPRFLGRPELPLLRGWKPRPGPEAESTPAPDASR